MRRHGQNDPAVSLHRILCRSTISCGATPRPAPPQRAWGLHRATARVLCCRPHCFFNSESIKTFRYHAAGLPTRASARRLSVASPSSPRCACNILRKAIPHDAVLLLRPSSGFFVTTMAMVWAVVGDYGLGWGLARASAMIFSISSGVRGSLAVSSWLPSAVTRTSSSMRTPIFSSGM